VVDRERPDDVHLVVQIEPVRDDRLRQLVSAEGGEPDGG